jgi:transposase
LDQNNPEEIARIFGCGISTVRRIIERFVKCDSEVAKKRGGVRNIKIFEIHKAFICSCIEEN